MRILLICDAIAPLQGIASIRWTKIAKYLKETHGNDVIIDVLTNKKNYDDPNSSLRLYPKDILLEKDMRYFDNYFDVVVTNGLRFANWYKRKVIGKDRHFITGTDVARHSIKMRLKARIRTTYETYYSYVVCRALWSFIKEKVDQYDVIISSYNPIWPFMLAYKMKSHNFKIKWIADFRDTCGRDNIDMAGYAPWHRNYVMNRSYLADVVLHVDDFINTYTNKSVKDYTVTNGYDPEEATAPQRPERFELVYTGSIYGNQQDFSVVYKVINELIYDEEVDKEKIRVIYAGRYGEQAQIMSEEQGGTGYFVNLSEVSRYKVHELQRKAAILIQAAFNIEGDNCAWTGKMYEYMMAQKPIVYIVNGNKPYSLPSKYMESLGGVCYENSRHEETYPELKKYIKEKYDEWVQTGNIKITQDRQYVERYSYRAIAEQVWMIINDI